MIPNRPAESVKRSLTAPYGGRNSEPAAYRAARREGAGSAVPL